MISIAIELDPNGHPTRSFRPKLMAPPRWRPLHKAAVHGDVKELDRARAAPSFDVCFLKLFSSKFFLFFPLSLFFIGTTGGPIIASNLAFFPYPTITYDRYERINVRALFSDTPLAYVLFAYILLVVPAPAPEPSTIYFNRSMQQTRPVTLLYTRQ